RENLRKIKHVMDNYRIPFIELKGIETDEVCEIFERVNQEGEPLDIFDIVVAKTFRPEGHPDGGFYLREMVDNFKENTPGEFVDIDYKTYLRMLAMIIRQNIEDSSVHNITDTYLNNITAKQIEQVWEGAKEAFRDTFDFFENYLHLKGPTLIPYSYFYITISSYFYKNDDPDYDFLKKYFWYYSFHNEQKLKHTQHLRYDHLELLEDVKQGEEFEFEPFMLDRNDLREASYSYSGRFSRAILSLLSSQDPKDWTHPDKSVLADVYYHLRDKPNLHHIFPRGFVKSYPGDNELDEDSLMNIAYIPQITNLEISDKNPIDYLKDYDREGFEEVLETHLIPEIILEWSRNDELGHKYLDEFIEKRIKIFEDELREKLEGIPFNVMDSRAQDTNIQLLIEDGEGQNLEFKSTFKTDIENKGKPTRVIQYQSIRAINSFLNTLDGGKLLIGVSDDGSIFGLEEDYRTFSKDDKREPFKRAVYDKISKFMEEKFNEFIDVSFFTVDGKDICMVEVEHADSPAFTEFEGDEEFYVRRGNRTVPLSPKKQTSYINKNFEEFS
ncbi:MAG: RNA-binding domain-containing protein, partial [Candidatus Thermoplasmatota archaeon]